MLDAIGVDALKTKHVMQRHAPFSVHEPMPIVPTSREAWGDILHAGRSALRSIAVDDVRTVGDPGTIFLNALLGVRDVALLRRT